MSKVENIYHEAFDAYLDLECKNGLHGNLNFNSNRILKIAEPTYDSDVTTKKYVDDVDATLLKLDGTSEMEAPLNLGDFKIISLGEPERDTDATTKSYVDGEDVTFLKFDGTSRPMTGDLDLGNNKISNVGVPVDNQDATTKNYVDDKDATFLKLDGSRSMQSDLNLDNHKITNLLNPTDNQNATTKSYVDAKDATFLKLDGTREMTGVLNLDNHKISNVSNPTANQDVATKNYVDDKHVRFLKLDGSSPMQSDLNLDNHKITNVTNPTENTDATTKSYVDAKDAIFLKLDGSSPLTGVLNLGTNKISNVSNPTDHQDVATKTYVDINFLNVNGSRPMLGELNLDNNKIISLGEPEIDTDATTKSYVDESDQHIITTDYIEHIIHASRISSTDARVDIMSKTNWVPSSEFFIVYDHLNDGSIMNSFKFIGTNWIKCPFDEVEDNSYLKSYIISSKLKIRTGAKISFKIETTSPSKESTVQLWIDNNTLSIRHNTVTLNTNIPVDTSEYFDFEFFIPAEGSDDNDPFIRINGTAHQLSFNSRFVDSETNYNGITLMDSGPNLKNYCYVGFVSVIILPNITLPQKIVDKLSKTITILHTPPGKVDYTFVFNNQLIAPQYSKIIIRPLNIGGNIILKNNDHFNILYNCHRELKILITSNNDIVLTNISPDPTYLHYVLY